jgi:dTDP-glucose 4,6-dehydratase
VVHRILQAFEGPECFQQFVFDRLGYDRRYAYDCDKLKSAVGWVPQFAFDRGLEETIRWYQENTDWLDSLRRGEDREYFERHYTHRAVTFGAR